MQVLAAFYISLYERPLVLPVQMLFLSLLQLFDILDDFLTVCTNYLFTYNVHKQNKLSYPFVEQFAVTIAPQTLANLHKTKHIYFK